MTIPGDQVTNLATMAGKKKVVKTYQHGIYFRRSRRDKANRKNGSVF